MQITCREFSHFCPSAAAPDDSIFGSVQSAIADRMAAVSALITPALFARLDNTCIPSPAEEHADRYIGLQRAVKGYVCNSAYYLAIPSLDLVLTSTGFGVVSNQNVVPASEARVRELRDTVDKAAFGYLEDILDLCRPLIRWRESVRGRDFFRSLFWRGAHLHMLGLIHPTIRDIREHMPQIEAAAARLSLRLSPELYRRLLDVESTATATEWQERLIDLWRGATVAWIRRDETWEDHCSSMLGFVEAHLDEFPEYRDSRTYQANHFTPYRNEKDDSCYFFG